MAGLIAALVAPNAAAMYTHAVAWSRRDGATFISGYGYDCPVSAGVSAKADADYLEAGHHIEASALIGIVPRNYENVQTMWYDAAGTQDWSPLNTGGSHLYFASGALDSDASTSDNYFNIRDGEEIYAHAYARATAPNHVPQIKEDSEVHGCPNDNGVEALLNQLLDINCLLNGSC